MSKYLGEGDGWRYKWSDMFVLACQVGHLPSVELLARECGVKELIALNRQPLEAAIMLGNPGVVQFLVQQGAIIVSQKDTLEQQPSNAVVVAVMHERLEVVRYLVKEGGEEAVERVDWQNKAMTPLIAACDLNLHEVAEYLLRDAHADPDLLDGHRKVSPLLVAIRNDDPRMFLLLRTYGARLNTEHHHVEQLFIEACRSGSSEIVSHLIQVDGIQPSTYAMQDVDHHSCIPLFEALCNSK